MKKICIPLIAIMILISSLVVAQVTIIPKAGLAISSIKFDDSDIQDDIESKVGFMIGVGFMKTLQNEALSIQGELNFIQKGAKASPSEGFFGYDEEWLIAPSYLEVPVMLKYSFSEGKFFIEGGLSMGFLLGGKATIEGDEDYEFGESYETGDMKIKAKDEDFFISEDVEEFYYSKGTDFGLQFGVGMNLGKVIIDIRYGLGLTKVIDYSDLDFVGSSRAWQFTLGYPIAK